MGAPKVSIKNFIIKKKNVQSDPRVTQELLLFKDKVIHKLRIKKGSRKDFNFFKNFQQNQHSLMQKLVDRLDNSFGVGFIYVEDFLFISALL